MSFTDKDKKQFKKSIKKVLTPCEQPPDQQHARNIIGFTLQLEGGSYFWKVIKQCDTLYKERFTVWKFCNLLHKILYHAHRQFILDSQQHKIFLWELESYWSCQRKEMGLPIAIYLKFLRNKLDFHNIFAFFVPNLRFQSVINELDTNICFQFTSDALDLIEVLLQLQRIIFAGVQSNHLEETSPYAQCRQTPVVTVVEECQHLYTLCEQALRVLCGELSEDYVIDLIHRFNIIYFHLKQFYNHILTNKLLADMIDVPDMPSTEPTFATISASPLLSYTPTAPPLEFN